MRNKVFTHPNAHLEKGLWMFVYECDSQPPRGDPHLQKQTEIEKIRIAHNYYHTARSIFLNFTIYFIKNKEF